MNDTTSRFQRVAKQPLRLLTKFGGAELTEKLGLRAPAGRVLHDTAKLAGTIIASTQGKPKRDPSRLKSATGASRFDLRPSEEQEMLVQTARRFAEDILRPAAHDADKNASPPAEILARAQELTLAALAIPEAHGGIAETRGVVTSTLLIEELARGDMGLALAILAPLGFVNAVVDFGTESQQAALLPKFVGDAFVPAALAVLEGRPGFDPYFPRSGAVRARDGGFVLHGEKALVPLASLAEVFLVAAEIRGAGPRLFVVPKDAPGLTVVPQPAMGLRAAGLGRLKLEGVHVPREALLGGDEGFRDFDFAQIVQRARLAWAALGVGGAQAVLDYVLPYCNERKAFGEPISNRQSVAFLIADMAIEIEGTRLMLRRAASLAEAGQDVAKLTSMLRVHASGKCMKVGTDGVQLLGGHGFVKDHPVERWYRDLRAVGVMEGALSA